MGSVGAVDPLHLVHARLGDATSPPLVLVSSIGMTERLWDAQTGPFVGAGLGVVTYRQRGHRGSPVPSGPYRIDDLGGDLVGLLDVLEIERASLCGASLGGMVALWTAAHHPDRVERLVVVCTSAHPGDPQKWNDRIEDIEAGRLPEVARRASGGWFTDEWAASHRQVVDELVEVVAANPAAGYAASCAVVRDVNLRPDLPQIQAPTLVIAGARDRGFPPSHAEEIHQAIGGSRLEVLPDTAHLPCVDQPTRFNALVLEHLGPVLAPTSTPSTS
ncbi:MAG: alpha/beta fold hydrolase [Nocardioides sp.]